MRQDVPAQHPPPSGARRPGRLDEDGVADPQRLRPHHPGEGGDGRYPDRDCHVDRPDAERRHQRQGQQERRDREQHVDGPHDDLVDPAAEEAGDETGGGSHDQPDRNSDHGCSDRERCAVHDPGEQVASELVGPEQMMGLRRSELVRRHPDDRVGGR